MTLRDDMISQAVETATANGNPITLESLSAVLPADFELGADEVPAAPIAGKLHVAEATDSAAAIDDADFLGDPEPAPPPTEIEIAAAEDALVAANDALGRARANVQACQWRERGARDALAKAIGSWQSGFAPYSPVDLAKDYAAGEAAQRGRVARGEAPPREQPRPANSVIDRMAWHRAPDIEAGKFKAWARRPPSVR
jgi:hypothetical protein